MTIVKLLEGCEHDGSYIPVGEVKRLMKEYARLMCDKQKEICYINSATKRPVLNSSYPEELL